MKPHQPPAWARTLFKFLAGNAKVDDLMGDIDEWFYLNLKTKSPWRAKILYCQHVLSLASSYTLRKRKQEASLGTYSSNSLSPDMLKNYFKVAVRNLYQYKYFSILNVFGLAIGMSISLLLIGMYSYVSTYDNFHALRDRTYVVTSVRSEGVEVEDLMSSPFVLAEKIETEFSGAEEILRIHRTTEQVVTPHENISTQAYYVEPAFLKVFNFQLLQGSAASLNDPKAVLLTQSAAEKFFSTREVVGKTLELAGFGEVLVAGLIANPPKNSHLEFELLLSFHALPESALSHDDQWANYRNQYVYVVMKEHNSIDDLNTFLNATSQRAYAQNPVKAAFKPMPIEGITMAELRNSIGPQWEVSGFLLFGIFAAMILLPACFNYTNISIARALKRAKEIGLRKTMGSNRSQILFQFVTETVVITFIALVVALGFYVVLRNEFLRMLVSASSLDLSLTLRMVLMFLAFALFTGLVAGLFPALYFSKLNPIQALKSKVNTKGSSGMRIRKVLTVFQFVISFGFILSLIVFNRQYQYSLNFNFGFEKKNLVDIELQDVKPELVAAEFAKLASVKSISMSSSLLGVGNSETWVHTNENDSTDVAQQFVNSNYIPNLGLKLLAGKNFPNEEWQRERYIIVNEEFLKHYKIPTPADALGKIFTVENQELEIIGVLQNFHFAPLRFPITKFFFRMNPHHYAYANLQVTSTDAFSLFGQMEEVWKKLPTEKKFVGKYFEEELNEAYSSYQSVLKIVGFLGLLAITISLLGMLGMVVYTAETKVKEVSIRKVMGATVGSIIVILSKDYLKLMLVAVVVAVPITAYLFSILLPEIQYYSVTLSAWDVLVSMFILFSLGIATIVSQTYKTAMTNPAETLRSE